MLVRRFSLEFHLTVLAGVFLGLARFERHTIAGGPPLCAPPPAGMAAWWPGDGNANDIVGGNNGTLQNGATFASGMVGQAFTFPNSNSQVFLPDNPSLTPQTLTVDAWIAATTPPNCCAAVMVAKTDDGGGGQVPPTTGYEFGIDGTDHPGKLVFDVNGGNGGGVIYSKSTVANGLLHHVGATYDGAVMKLYVDGVLDNQVSVDVSISYNTGDPLIIGNRLSNLPHTVVWPGIIDELEIFNRSLSQPEIQSIFNAGSSGKCRPRPRATPRPRPTPVPRPTS